ncbi:hypothetical protein EV200_104524 [Pedobacter psychrotolerans]|uniref:LIVCS family branched-chain amino acid:cation transporter n=1 Tax=Pedobacter psychrotolerans TaxID=1843235 RepID=A0A4R2HCI4_9SPHI|nr:hypothetical protein [Pedobacter psychrotolerans]TCO25486.1 hypothetical protein EV200_104524 [Pedobacter psychrotolerans]GGE45073.1 hypothetical protein GCM10011413_09010 [Pedobacter psychrotolerans]
MEPLIIRIGKKAALCSAAVGTFLLLAFLISKQNLLIAIGLNDVMLAFIMNTIILLALIAALFLNTAHWKNIVVAIVCVLLNIPLSILYLTIIIN